MLSGLPFVFLSCCFTQPILRLDVRFIKECRLPVREVRQKSCHTGNGCLSSLCCPFIFIDMNSNYYDCMKIIMQARHNVSGFDCCCQRGLWNSIFSFFLLSSVKRAAMDLMLEKLRKKIQALSLACRDSS